MTNDGKLEWRLPAAPPPCQQRRIRGAEGAEKKGAVKYTQTNTQTGRHGAHVHTKTSGWHRARRGSAPEGDRFWGLLCSAFDFYDLVFVFRTSNYCCFFCSVLFCFVLSLFSILSRMWWFKKRTSLNGTTTRHDQWRVHYHLRSSIRDEQHHTGRVTAQCLSSSSSFMSCSLPLTRL